MQSSTCLAPEMHAEQHEVATTRKLQCLRLFFGCLALLTILATAYTQSLLIPKFWTYVTTTTAMTTTVFTGSGNENILTDGLTVVTAYFNIGKFQKGNGGSYFTPQLYRNWARVFARLKSPTVIFVDSEEYRRYFSELRSIHLPANMTVVQLLDRQQMWAFQLQSAIAKIFSRTGYPVHVPNTVVPAYSAAMHAKYEVTQMAMELNPFRTRFFCWLDVGLFRDLSPSGVNGSCFSLGLPPKLDIDAVAYTEVSRPNSNLSVRQIVSEDRFWVCGCFFVGRIEVLQVWIREYMAATEKMIEDGWMSTDQQVIYAMYNTMHPKTKLQLYHSDGRYNNWFHLGYLARDAGTSS